MNIYNLPDQDKGIDAIVYDNDDRVYAVQIKYRKYIDNLIPFGELSTFPALTFGSKVKNIYKGIFFTNCIDVCEELKDDKFINIVYTCFDKCDNLFWTNVREYIGDKKITEYVPMKPLPHQEKIIPIIKKYYEENNYGRLYLACGTGKSFISYWISTQELKMNKIFIAVPSLYLLSQMFETYQRELQKEKLKKQREEVRLKILRD